MRLQGGPKRTEGPRSPGIPLLTYCTRCAVRGWAARRRWCRYSRFLIGNGAYSNGAAAEPANDASATAALFRSALGVATLRNVFVDFRSPQKAAVKQPRSADHLRLLQKFPLIKGGDQCGAQLFARASTFATEDTCHCPPRAVRTPRSFSSLAMPSMPIGPYD